MSSSMETVRESVVNLLGGIVDYSGLFPPAKLDMRPVCENYAAYMRSEHEWMLGRLVVPVSRFAEFEEASADLLTTDDDAEEAWLISAVVGQDVDADISKIFEFNARHASDEDGGDGETNGLAMVDVIEVRADSVERIEEILDLVPEQLEAFIEVPWDRDNRGLIAAIGGPGRSGGEDEAGAFAKIRTGHVNAELIPTPEAVARFIMNCAQARVPFKATAGLHHPIRADYPLTYEPGSAIATMHGIFNVFTAAAMARIKRADEQTLLEILNEKDASKFVFADDTLTYNGVTLTSEELVTTRDSFALSIGSCSFTEPTEDITALGLFQ